MGLATLYNVPQSGNDISVFAFSHMASHRDINHAIFRKFGIALPEFVLDPMNVGNLTTMLYLHQEMHNDQNAILGIAGNDLLDVDWRVPSQREIWVFFNATEHRLAHTALGI